MPFAIKAKATEGVIDLQNMAIDATRSTVDQLKCSEPILSDAIKKER